MFDTIYDQYVYVGQTFKFGDKMKVIKELEVPYKDKIRIVKHSFYQKLMALYQDFFEICKSNGIQCWLSGGTLLGYVRNGGYLPWDDDLDLHLNIKDYQKLLHPDFRKVLKERNIELLKTRVYRTEILRICRTEDLNFKRRMVFIDLLFEGELNGRWGTLSSNKINDFNITQFKSFSRHLRKKHFKLIEKEIWPKDFVYPLQKIQYEGCEALIPHRSDDILKIQYGNNYSKEYKFSNEHDLFPLYQPILGAQKYLSNNW